jgi:hypothetical protein
MSPVTADRDPGTAGPPAHPPPGAGVATGPVATMAPCRRAPGPAAPPRFRRLFPCE